MTDPAGIGIRALVTWERHQNIHGKAYARYDMKTKSKDDKDVFFHYEIADTTNTGLTVVNDEHNGKTRKKAIQIWADR
jgi:hypothetical protein